MRKKRWVQLGAILMGCVILAAAISGAYAFLNCGPVATVNGIPVTVEEFRLAMDQHRAMVIQDYTENHGMNYGGDFWAPQPGGDGPLERLKQLALEDLVRTKTVECLAAELGLVERTGFSAMREAMRNENKSRAENAQSGRVVYGALAFTEQTFYDYYYTNLEIQLKNALMNGVLALDEQDCEDYLRQHPEEFQRYYLRFELLSIPHGGDRVGASGAAEQAFSAVMGGASFQAAALLGGSVSEEEITDENLRSYAKYEEGIFTLLDGLEPGETEGPFDWNGQFVIVRCIQKGGRGEKPLDEVKGDIEVALSTQRFQAYLEEQIAAAKIDIHETVLSRLTMT